MKYTKLLFSIVFTLLSVAVFGQSQLRRQQPAQMQQVPQQRKPVAKPVVLKQQPTQQQPKQTQSGRVELIGADSLKGGTFNGRRIDKLLGNVRFKQKETFL